MLKPLQSLLDSESKMKCFVTLYFYINELKKAVESRKGYRD